MVQSGLHQRIDGADAGSTDEDEGQVKGTSRPAGRQGQRGSLLPEYPRILLDVSVSRCGIVGSRGGRQPFRTECTTSNALSAWNTN